MEIEGGLEGRAAEADEDNSHLCTVDRGGKSDRGNRLICPQKTGLAGHEIVSRPLGRSHRNVDLDWRRIIVRLF